MSNRKRALEESLQEASLNSTNDGDNTAVTVSTAVNTTNTTTMPPPCIQSLSLEAMFHPKFDNENRSSQEIRKAMKQKIASRQGYLEVSLKHSGTLLLWSGGQRYYSKNSTANSFTAVGEVLLRQHCARVHGDYQACSDCIQHQRLTLCFECVTSVLGHHGDLPKRDFLILTAVADRAHRRFYSTVELLHLAQQFRLPHNDVWVYATTAHVDQLFVLYDTTRETGLARDTIAALDASATEHVSSMYPHVDFQGDILEGIVIRYVEGDAAAAGLGELVKISQRTLLEVPPSAPASFEVPQESLLLATDIRRLYQDCIDHGGYTDLTARLGKAVVKILQESDGERRVVDKRKRTEWDIPCLARELLTKDVDEETKRIATVIQTADQLKARIDYAVFRENSDRWLCMIHVLHDQTFRKYQQLMEKTDMHLYRGFCIELGVDRVAKDRNGDDDKDSTMMDFNLLQSNEDASLMLKMKFLPYMVRTFGCRNGLSVIENGGPTAFAQYAMKMMTQWGISQASQLKWQPFFEAWGSYANACMKALPKEFINPKLPPLTENCYLTHLEYFTPLYEAGKLNDLGSDIPSAFSNSTYRALVVVVALTVELAEKVADYLSSKLGGVRRIHDVNAITDQDLIMMKVAKGGGLVCSCIPEDGQGSLKKYMKKHADSISVVIYGCEQEKMSSMLLPDGQGKKRLGMISSWQKLRCKSVTEVAECEELDASDEFESVLSNLREASDAAPKSDNRPGILVFFPGIPGSGKSTLCSVDVMSALKEACRKPVGSSFEERQVVLLTGDKFNKKYWPHIKETRTLNSASIYIADKNAPASAWGTVGDSTCKGISIPVIPDEQALRTTSVTGIRFPDGDTNVSSNHTYPFSLHYLAVCVARVLARPPTSHPGKLDTALPILCMIVVKFFGLYRNIAADELIDNIRRKIESSGSLSTPNPIQVPFFQTDMLPDLPVDLEQALIGAIQLQYGYDIKKKNTSDAKDEIVVEAESMLRTSVETHIEWLLSLTINPDVSKKAFVSQVADHAKALEEEKNKRSDRPDAPLNKPLVKIVSLDISVTSLHEMVKMHSSELSSFFEMAIGDFEELPEGKLPGLDFIPNTHVTLVHFSAMPQSDIHSSYGHLVGKEVEVKLVGLLWSDRVAALAVEISLATIDGIPMPSPSNEFTHISIWCRKSASPFESNYLPSLVSTQKAQRVDFKSAPSLRGVLSFWPMENSSKAKAKAAS